LPPAQEERFSRKKHDARFPRHAIRAKLFGGPRRSPKSEITQREMDIAASIQAVTEEVVLRLARTLHRETGERCLCLAGGVALNCVVNAEFCAKARSRASRTNRWRTPAAPSERPQPRGRDAA